jgi:hypothetical protein
LHKRGGYSHDSLNGHEKFVRDKIRYSSDDKAFKNDMRNTLALAELNFVPKLTILVGDTFPEEVEEIDGS